MIGDQKTTVLKYELAGIFFIALLGGLFHFTFEISNYQPIVGVFSAVNESVWEHLKLGFWPSVLYAIIEYRFIKRDTNNFFLAKAAVPYAITGIIPLVFYSYTSITGESIFAIDIMSFIVAVIIGQILSYKLLTRNKMPEILEKIALIALIVLGTAFIIFTFYPPHLPIFQDPITSD